MPNSGGGAGTFSDGKLYSQVSDPSITAARCWRNWWPAAPTMILTLHRPHIGTFKLATVPRTAGWIEAQGVGPLRQPCRSVAARVDRNPAADGDRMADGRRIPTGTVLAPGHSADCFAMLDVAGCNGAETLSVSASTPSIADRSGRWGDMAGHPPGAAEYKLVHHAGNGRCVYSFCMSWRFRGGRHRSRPCGDQRHESALAKRAECQRWSRGESEPRDRPYSRHPGDPRRGGSAGDLEERAFRLGGGSYAAPAQRLEDF